MRRHTWIVALMAGGAAAAGCKHKEIPVFETVRAYTANDSDNWGGDWEPPKGGAYGPPTICDHRPPPGPTGLTPPAGPCTAGGCNPPQPPPDNQPFVDGINALKAQSQQVLDAMDDNDPRKQFVATQQRIIEKLANWAPTLPAQDAAWLMNILTTFLGSVNNYIKGNKWDPNGDELAQFKKLAQGQIGAWWWNRYDQDFATWQARHPNPNALQPQPYEWALAGMASYHINFDLYHALLFWGVGTDANYAKIGEFVQQAAAEVATEYNAKRPAPLQRPGASLQDFAGRAMGISPATMREEMRARAKRELQKAGKNGPYDGAYGTPPPPTCTRCKVSFKQGAETSQGSIAYVQFEWLHIEEANPGGPPFPFSVQAVSTPDSDYGACLACELNMNINGGAKYTAAAKTLRFDGGGNAFLGGIFPQIGHCGTLNLSLSEVHSTDPTLLCSLADGPSSYAADGPPCRVDNNTTKVSGNLSIGSGGAGTGPVQLTNLDVEPGGDSWSADDVTIQ
jgi:hypothetical protein